MLFAKSKRLITEARIAWREQLGAWSLSGKWLKEGSGKEKSRLNSIRLSGDYAFHLLEHRDSATTGYTRRPRSS